MPISTFSDMSLTQRWSSWRAVGRMMLQLSLPLGFLIILAIPAYTYFVVSHAGVLLFAPGVDPSIRFYTLFRLFGLYAFIFLWGQVMLGPLLAPLSALYGRSWVNFHRTQGLFALLLACLHPAVFYAAYYLDTQRFDFINAIPYYTENVVMVYLGAIALTLLLVTVTTASLRRRPWMRQWWHWVHLLNYLVFVLVFVHSLQAGSDVRVQPLAFLYWLLGVSFLLSLIYRRVWRPVRGQDNL